MTTDKTILVGNPCTDVVTGVGTQFDSIVAGFRSRGLLFELVDRTRAESGTAQGRFGFARALRTLRLVAEYYCKLPRARRVYLTLGSSRVGFLRDLLMIAPAVAAGRRVVAHLHGGGYKDFFAAQPGWLQALVARTLSRVDHLLVNGELLRDQFWFVRDLDRRVAVVPNGVPPPEPAPSERRLLPGKPVRLLYLSNMLESKGYLDVLAACRTLKRELGRPFGCDFCGAFVDTAYDARKVTAQEARERFERQVREWGLEDAVRYHGTVKGEQKRALLRNAHVFALPTSFPGEGQPVSIIEAISYGVPVVTTRYRGIPELIQDGENGLFVEPRAPDQIAAAVERIVASPESFQHFSQRARAVFAERFTETAHVTAVLGKIFGSSL